ncbi:MAG: hypothetical protein ACLFPQ_01345 [Candidatus Woesearchaeota archaeon]
MITNYEKRFGNPECSTIIELSVEDIVEGDQRTFTSEIDIDFTGVDVGFETVKRAIEDELMGELYSADRVWNEFDGSYSITLYDGLEIDLSYSDDIKRIRLSCETNLDQDLSPSEITEQFKGTIGDAFQTYDLIKRALRESRIYSDEFGSFMSGFNYDDFIATSRVNEYSIGNLVANSRKKICSDDNFSLDYYVEKNLRHFRESISTLRNLSLDLELRSERSLKDITLMINKQLMEKGYFDEFRNGAYEMEVVDYSDEGVKYRFSDNIIIALSRSPENKVRISVINNDSVSCLNDAKTDCFYAFTYAMSYVLEDHFLDVDRVSRSLEEALENDGYPVLRNVEFPVSNLLNTDKNSYRFISEPELNSLFLDYMADYRELQRSERDEDYEFESILLKSRINNLSHELASRGLYSGEDINLFLNDPFRTSNTDFGFNYPE